jgi:hypothetical protein
LTDSQNDCKSVHYVVLVVLMYGIVHALAVVRRFGEAAFVASIDLPRVRRKKLYEVVL